MEKIIEKKNLKVEFVDVFFERYFDIINGAITKADNKIESLKIFISDSEISKTIYDEKFIYLCLCEIMINKLNNSIEHTCSNCNTECCGGLSDEKAKNCNKWTHDFITKTNKLLKKTL